MISIFKKILSITICLIMVCSITLAEAPKTFTEDQHDERRDYYLDIWYGLIEKYKSELSVQELFAAEALHDRVDNYDGETAINFFDKMFNAKTLNDFRTLINNGFFGAETSKDEMETIEKNVKQNFKTLALEQPPYYFYMSYLYNNGGKEIECEFSNLDNIRITMRLIGINNNVAEMNINRVLTEKLDKKLSDSDINKITELVNDVRKNVVNLPDDNRPLIISDEIWSASVDEETKPDMELVRVEAPYILNSDNEKFDETAVFYVDINNFSVVSLNVIASNFNEMQ